MNRKVYAQASPKVEYSLTEMGLRLKPVLDAMWVWDVSYQKMQGEG